MKIKVLAFVFALFCLKGFVISGISSNETGKIDAQNSIPENVIYAHVFYLVADFDKNNGKEIAESGENYFQSYFKKEALLNNEQNQILMSIADNFTKVFPLTSGKRRFDISLDYKNDLKNAFGSDEFNRFDNFVKINIAPGIKYIETENLGVSGSSSISLDETNHILHGSSITIVFFFSPKQTTNCSVSATMSGQNVSVSGSDFNCNGQNPQVDLSSTQYVANSQYIINGTHSFGEQTFTTSDSLITPNISNVISIVFQQVTPGNIPLNENPNEGGGLRIYPDKITPTDSIDRSIVAVKAVISPVQSNVKVYFKSFDIDEPSTNDLPLDTNGNNFGNDNRGPSFQPITCSLNPTTSCSTGKSGLDYALTDIYGEAVVYFSVNGAHPGDNYAVGASIEENDLNQTIVEGLNIKNYNTNRIFQIDVDRTKMLTVWRKLHIEVDSMGEIQNNDRRISTNIDYLVRNRSVKMSLINNLDPKRFENGRMFLTNINKLLRVDDNDANSVMAHYPFGKITVSSQYVHLLYDDDDFNSDAGVNGFDGDNGENISYLPDSFDLLQENDDKDCSDKKCNVFAEAYIMPEYNWASPYNDSDLSYSQNFPFQDFDTTLNPRTVNQINVGRNQNSGENDDFWVVYVQINYQPTVETDCDPNAEPCTGGYTPNFIFGIPNGPINDATSENMIPKGSIGSIVFIETMRDQDNHTLNDFENDNDAYFRIKAIPHEIGHQFSLAGDNSENFDFGLMSYTNNLTIHARHLNVLRWRKKSPGEPRN